MTSLLSAQGGSRSRCRRGQGKLGSTFWPIRATGHESAVSLPGLGLRQQQRSQRSEASLSCLAVSRRVASRQSKYLSSSIWNSVCHLTNVTGSSKQGEWQEGGIAGISEATGEVRVAIGVAAGLLSWHTFWPVALLNVFIFAFYLRRVAAMTNDYRNKLSQGWEESSTEE